MLSPLRMGVRTALNAVAVVVRVLAVALCVLVVVDSFDVGTLHTALLGVNGLATGAIPQPIQGYSSSVRPWAGPLGETLPLSRLHSLS